MNHMGMGMNPMALNQMNQMQMNPQMSPQMQMNPQMNQMNPQQMNMMGNMNPIHIPMNQMNPQHLNMLGNMNPMQMNQMPQNQTPHNSPDNGRGFGNANPLDNLRVDTNIQHIPQIDQLGMQLSPVDLNSPGAFEF